MRAARLVFDGVRHEGAHFFRRGQLAGEIERHAAQESGVVYGGGGLDLEPLQFGVDQPVDVVVLRERLPGKARLGIQNGHRQCGEIALVADQQGGFAHARALHRSVGHSGDIGHVAFDYGFLA